MPPKDKILPCCGHSQSRHEMLTKGNRSTKAVYICLTGFCRCGRPPLKPKPRKKSKTNTPGPEDYD